MLLKQQRSEDSSAANQEICYQTLQKALKPVRQHSESLDDLLLESNKEPMPGSVGGSGECAASQEEMTTRLKQVLNKGDNDQKFLRASPPKASTLEVIEDVAKDQKRESRTENHDKTSNCINKEDE